MMLSATLSLMPSENGSLFRALQRFHDLLSFRPGPMAQAISFRAFRALVQRYITSDRH